MSDTIRLLETRVGAAVDRIRRLRQERDGLTREVETLRQQVDAGHESVPGADRDERDRVVRELRETLADLEPS